MIKKWIDSRLKERTSHDGAERVAGTRRVRVSRGTHHGPNVACRGVSQVRSLDEEARRRIAKVHKEDSGRSSLTRQRRDK